MYRFCLLLTFVTAALLQDAHAADLAPQILKCKGKSADAAARSLVKRIRAERLYESWAKEGCLAYQMEGCDSKRIDVVVREVHSPACGGDPATGPVVDRFRVSRDGKRMEWYNAAEAEYVEFENVHTVGHR
jgi:hypothetical protein